MTETLRSNRTWRWTREARLQVSGAEQLGWTGNDYVLFRKGPRGACHLP